MSKVFQRNRRTLLSTGEIKDGLSRYARMKRPFSLFAGCLLLIGLPMRAADKPNVVLFLVDDMGWMDTGVYGSQYYETPNVDAFAKTAMRFTQAYANPLCSPTRASILTGKYSTRHGILTASGHQPPHPPGHDYMPKSAPANRPFLTPESKNYLDPAEFNLAEALRAEGYRTAHIGKWHLGLNQEHRPDQQGFEVTFHCAPDPGPPGEYFSPYGVQPEGKPTAKTKVGNITDGPEGEYIVDRQAEEAVNFIRTSKDRPFFLNLWCYGVHGPWGHKQAYTAEFAQKKDPSGRQKNPIMASMLRSVDECFGRVLKELDTQGLLDNTIVIFFSDNGGNVHSNVPNTTKTAAAEKSKSDFMADWRRWAGNEPPTNNAPLREGKGKLYEGGTRVPMMWAWAGKIPAGEVTDAIAGHIDIYPTVIELAGLAKPKQDWDGISLAPLLTGKVKKLARDSFFNYFPYATHQGGVTVRQGDFKLIRWFDPAVPRELYDLNQDLGESTNLAESQPEKTAALDRLIDEFLESTGALVPKPNPAYRPRTAGTTPTTARPLQGWVPKACSATVESGALVIAAEGRQPFLGRSGLNLTGPVTLKIASSGETGAAKVQWRRTDQETFPENGQTQAFELGAEGGSVVLETPNLHHLRLYLPVAHNGLRVQSIELHPKQGKPMVFQFR